jgi:short subunit dehydrogenase-like uncharacterized protein
MARKTRNGTHKISTARRTRRRQRRLHDEAMIVVLCEHGFTGKLIAELASSKGVVQYTAADIYRLSYRLGCKISLYRRGENDTAKAMIAGITGARKRRRSA